MDVSHEQISLPKGACVAILDEKWPGFKTPQNLMLILPGVIQGSKIKPFSLLFTTFSRSKKAKP
jgi:hypothetical protein